MIDAPKPYPCASCPYRRDVPPGVWAPQEYDKLPAYDRPTAYQPPNVFACHQDDDHICSGWAGAHDAPNLLGLRIGVGVGLLTREAYEDTIAYESPVPLFDSGTQASAHGLSGIDAPPESARRVVGKIARRRARRGGAR